MTIAVLPADAKALTRIDKYPNDFAKLRRVFERHAKDGEIRACYEASRAGYVLQREVAKSRHYVLKFLARRCFIYRAGIHRRPVQYTWLRQLTDVTSPLAPEDQIVFGEYFELLEYKLSRRDALDQHIEVLAPTPAYASAVARELIGYLWAVMRELDAVRATTTPIAA